MFTLSSSEAELVALSEAAKDITSIIRVLLSIGIEIELPIISKLTMLVLFSWPKTLAPVLEPSMWMFITILSESLSKMVSSRLCLCKPRTIEQMCSPRMWWEISSTSNQWFGVEIWRVGQEKSRMIANRKGVGQCCQHPKKITCKVKDRPRRNFQSYHDWAYVPAYFRKTEWKYKIIKVVSK